MLNQATAVAKFNVIKIFWQQKTYIQLCNIPYNFHNLMWIFTEKNSIILLYYIQKGLIKMLNREITINELKTTINEIGDLEEPIIVRRNNKKDFIIIDLEEYQKSIFLSKLEKSKRDYKEGKYKKAKDVFKKLDEEHGY